MGAAMRRMLCRALASGRLGARLARSLSCAPSPTGAPTGAPALPAARRCPLGDTHGAPAFNRRVRDACDAGDLPLARAEVRRMREAGVAPTAWTYNTLLHGVATNGGGGKKRSRGDAPDAQAAAVRELLDEMAQAGVRRDFVTYTTLFRFHAARGALKDGVAALEAMQAEGVSPDTVSFNAVIDWAVRRGDLEAAEMLLTRMERACGPPESREGQQQQRPRGLRPDIVSFNLLARGYGAVGRTDEAYRILDRIRGVGLRPNAVTYNTLVKARCNAGDVEGGEALLEEMRAAGAVPDAVSYCTLMRAHSKRGSMDAAEDLLNHMRRAGVAVDMRVHNTLIDGWCGWGKAAHAWDHLRAVQAEGYKPDKHSYLPFIKLAKWHATNWRTHTDVLSNRERAAIGSALLAARRAGVIKANNAYLDMVARAVKQRPHRG